MRSPPAWRRSAPYDVAERQVAALRQAVRAPRRQPPVLPLLVERVRRGADGRAERERVLQRPGVRSSRVHPDGEVVDDEQALDGGQLLVDEQLDPAPEGDPLGRDGCPGGARPPELGRPLLPVRPVLLGQRAEQRELLQRRTLLPAPLCQVLLPVQRPQQLQRGELGPPHRVARDPVRLRDGAQRVDGGADVVGRRGVLRDVLDVEVDGGAEAAARRAVRRGVDRHDGRLGVQRVEQHGARPVGDGALDHGPQVGVVAHGPRLLAAQAVELDHPAPGAVQPPGQRDARRCHAEHRGRGGATGGGDQLVPAERQAGQRHGPADQGAAARGDHAGDVEPARAAVLEPDLQQDVGVLLHVQGDLAGAAQDDGRRQQPRPRRRLHVGQRGGDELRRRGVDVERRQRAGDRRVRHLHRRAGPVVVGGGDAVRARELLQFGGHGRPLPPRGAFTTSRGGTTRAALERGQVVQRGHDGKVA